LFRITPNYFYKIFVAPSSWKEHLADLGLDKVQGNAELSERLWNIVDANGTMYIWQMLLSF